MVLLKTNLYNIWTTGVHKELQIPYQTYHMAWVSKENKKLFNFVKVSEVRFNSYVIEVIPSSQEGFHCQKYCINIQYWSLTKEIICLRYFCAVL